MKKTGRLKGLCDLCGEQGELYGTEHYGAWLCQSCKEDQSPNTLDLRQVGGKVIITGLGI